MPYLIGALMALFSVIGLFMAAGAKDGVFAAVGFAVFLFGVLYVFGLIDSYAGKTSTDDA